ncbi:MAG: Isoprenylcysteine carboxyl methyltransferase family protein [Acidobacteria bacterium]|nr:Isoprenylcysteine carboxyl methyltransferase family protein [Acidobacteriota bacterium]
MDTRVAYNVLVIAVAAERVVELLISARNGRRARARGAVEAGRGHYPVMVAVHAAFLAACPLEVWRLHRPWLPALGLPMLALVVGAQALRYWVVRTLHGRWTTRVLYVPGDPLVTGGPYRWMRHPNYLAIVIEMAALPLVHTAWIAAVVFSAANAALLRRRIAAEERLLDDAGILAAVADVARAHLGWSGSLSFDTPLASALALDSLRQLTLIVELENRFRVVLDDDAEGLRTVGDLVAMIRRKGGRVSPDAR